MLALPRATVDALATRDAFYAHLNASPRSALSSGAGASHAQPESRGKIKEQDSASWCQDASRCAELAGLLLLLPILCCGGLCLVGGLLLLRRLRAGGKAEGQGPRRRAGTRARRRPKGAKRVTRTEARELEEEDEEDDDEEETVRQVRRERRGVAPAIDQFC